MLSTANHRIAVKRSRPARDGVVAVEAAVIMSVVMILMLGVWEVGRMIQVSCVLQDAAHEAARLAAGGVNNNSNNLTPVTVANVQTAAQNYLVAAGFPTAVANAAQVTVSTTCGWTDPGSAAPNDPFSVTVTLSGTAYSAMCWVPSNMTGLSQLSATVQWQSNNDKQVTVSTQLPY